MTTKTDEQERRDFEAWWESTPILKENKRTIAEKAYKAGRAALQSQDREDAARWQYVRKNPIEAIDSLRINCGHDPATWGDEAEKAIDHARRIEGDGK